MSETRRVIGALEDFTDQLLIRLSFSIQAELIERTPVDTGWARANWFFSVTVPSDRDPGPPPRRDGQGSFDTARVISAQAEQTVSQTSVLGYTIQSGAIFIQNNVDYIVFLNAGTSRQAPAGFVQDAITAGIRRVGRT